MTISQIFLITFALFIVYSWGKKFAISRKLKHYSAQEAKEKNKNPNVLLLDVRTDAERKQSSIKGSIHIPVGLLKSRLEELNKHKNKEIICYCRTGSRSVTAASILYKAGFNSANMRGGITAWN
jgi:rhodanese-related sulfurtransferase